MLSKSILNYIPPKTSKLNSKRRIVFLIALLFLDNNIFSFSNCLKEIQGMVEMVICCMYTLSYVCFVSLKRKLNAFHLK